MKLRFANLLWDAALTAVHQNEPAYFQQLYLGETKAESGALLECL